MSTNHLIDPLELENKDAQIKAMGAEIDDLRQEVQNLLAGRAYLQEQVSQLRAREVELKAERAVALEAADDVREELAVVRQRLHQIARKRSLPVEATKDRPVQDEL